MFGVSASLKGFSLVLVLFICVARHKEPSLHARHSNITKQEIIQ